MSDRHKPHFTGSYHPSLTPLKTAGQALHGLDSTQTELSMREFGCGGVELQSIGRHKQATEGGQDTGLGAREQP